MTSHIERNKVADRIRRMLEKATAEGSTEAEAAAFAEKAQALMLEHSISITEVHDTGEPDDETAEIDSELETDPQPWRRRLGTATATLFMCKYFYTTAARPMSGTKYDIHNFIGRRSRIIVAKMMFSYLIVTVDRLARDGAKQVPEKERSPYRVSFRKAASIRIGNRIGQRVDQAKQGGVIKKESGQTLPALITQYQQAEAEADAAIADKVGELRYPVRKTNFKDHPLGFVHGFEAGDKVGLDQQVGNDTSKRIGNK